MLLMVCMIVFARMPLCRGQSIADVLPDAGLQNLGLGTTESSFVQRFPGATKGSSREGAAQYLLPRSPGETLIVNFRNDHLALASLSYSSLTPNVQQELTTQILKRCRERYGKEQIIHVGKVVNEGAAKIGSALFNLTQSISVIVQSSEVELSVSMADFRLIDRERILIPFESIVDRLRNSDSLKPESVTPQQITDFIANGGINRSASQVPDLENEPSRSSKAPEPKPSATSVEPKSSTPWPVVVVMIAAAIGLVWMLLKNRK